MPPQKMVILLTLFNNSRKSEGATNEGAPCTQRISLVYLTLRWGRFSPPPPPKKNWEPKQIFEISAIWGSLPQTPFVRSQDFDGFEVVR